MICFYSLMDLLSCNFLVDYSDLWIRFFFFFYKERWDIRPEIESHRVKQKRLKTVLLAMKDKLLSWRWGQSITRVASVASPWQL